MSAADLIIPRTFAVPQDYAEYELLKNRCDVKATALAILHFIGENDLERAASLCFVLNRIVDGSNKAPDTFDHTEALSYVDGGENRMEVSNAWVVYSLAVYADAVDVVDKSSFRYSARIKEALTFYSAQISSNGIIQEPDGSAYLETQVIAYFTARAAFNYFGADSGYNDLAELIYASAKSKFYRDDKMYSSLNSTGNINTSIYSEGLILSVAMLHNMADSAYTNVLKQIRDEFYTFSSFGEGITMGPSSFNVGKIRLDMSALFYGVCKLIGEPYYAARVKNTLLNSENYNTLISQASYDDKNDFVYDYTGFNSPAYLFPSVYSYAHKKLAFSSTIVFLTSKSLGSSFVPPPPNPETLTIFEQGVDTIAFRDYIANGSVDAAENSSQTVIQDVNY